MPWTEQKEANYIAGLQAYVRAHGASKLWDLAPSLSADFPVPSSVALRKPARASLREYRELCSRVAGMFPAIRDHPHRVHLLVRYYIWGAFNNISLSVAPEVKRRWGITHELFSGFYNAAPSSTYCTLFPDLEAPQGYCNALEYEPEEATVLLANPPYTSKHIQWTVQQVLRWRAVCTAIWVVVPVWDAASRKALGLRGSYKDLPAITALIAEADEHHITKRFPFHDYVHAKDVHLADPVHVVKLLKKW